VTEGQPTTRSISGFGGPGCKINIFLTPSQIGSSTCSLTIGRTQKRCSESISEINSVTGFIAVALAAGKIARDGFDTCDPAFVFI